MNAPLEPLNLISNAVLGANTVPAGTMLFLELFHVHRCPDQWPEPEKFNPDNFLPERVRNRHPYAYVPFSAGPRNCIGKLCNILKETGKFSV